MDDLQAVLENLMAFGAENREFATQFVGEQLAAGKHAESIQMNFKAFLAELCAHLQDCIDAHLLRPHDTEVSAEALIELTKLYMRRKYLLKRLARPLPAYAPEVLDIFLNGFGRKGARKK